MSRFLDWYDIRRVLLVYCQYAHEINFLRSFDWQRSRGGGLTVYETGTILLVKPVSSYHMKAPAHPHPQRIDTYYRTLLEGDSNTDITTKNQYNVTPRSRPHACGS